jgi:hypothetical protein
MLDSEAGAEVVPARSTGAELIIAPVSGSVDADGTTLAQGDVRVEEADVDQPALVAGSDGAQLVLIFADRRALADAVRNDTLGGPLGAALAPTLDELQGQLTPA